jgi:hypothetical protein
MAINEAIEKLVAKISVKGIESQLKIKGKTASTIIPPATGKENPIVKSKYCFFLSEFFSAFKKQNQIEKSIPKEAKHIHK